MQRLGRASDLLLVDRTASVSASLLGPALITAVAALHLSIGIVEASTAGILLNFCGIGAAERARRSCLNW